MICEYCRHEIEYNATKCPYCGTVPSRPKSQPDSYGSQYQQGYSNTPPMSQQSYYPPTGAAPNSQPYQSQQIPQPPYQNYQMPPQYNVHVNIGPPPMIAAPPRKNDTALIAEIILSLFGLFGVGWLIAGETTTGVILLICSFLVYWPVVILGTIFTLGIGLICLGPLAIAGIILNAILLNKTLDRKASSFIVMPPPHSMY